MVELAVSDQLRERKVSRQPTWAKHRSVASFIKLFFCLCKSEIGFERDRYTIEVLFAKENLKTNICSVITMFDSVKADVAQLIIENNDLIQSMEFLQTEYVTLDKGTVLPNMRKNIIFVLSDG